MDIRNRRGLKAAAASDLAAASYDPRKLILIHNGVSIAVALVLSLIDHLLDAQIGGTGGLGGVGTRTMLETVQTVLYVAQMLCLVFWQIGYIYVSILISRRQSVGPGSLLEGFRRFFPVLRLQLLLGLMYFGVLFLCINVGSILFSVTPLAQPLLEAYEVGTEEAIEAAIEQCTLPVMAMTAVSMLVIALPYAYRLRLAEYALMDDPGMGARRAIYQSRVMMRGNRIQLLRLDLSFWWFYLAQGLMTVVAYGDLILPLLGYSLPWSETVSFYVFLVLSYLCQLALYWWKGNDVQVTYAKFYDALLPKEE